MVYVLCVYTCITNDSNILSFHIENILFSKCAFISSLYFYFTDGERVLKMDDSFFTGYRSTILKPNEILRSVIVPFTKKVTK